MRLPRWPALDGLRAVAVLAVIVYHFGSLPGGYLGVDLFFVLSGFLITVLLIQEWDRRDRISFRNFYARRVLRLFPALGCVITVTVILAMLMELSGLPGGRPYAMGTFEGIPWVVAFAGNWARAFNPVTSFLGFLGLLGQTWSLAVEEQFYLLWPALFVLLMRCRLARGAIAISLALTALGEMAYRITAVFAGYTGHRIYYGTDTHSDGLLIGCAIAFWLSSRPASHLPAKAGAPLKYAAVLAAAVLVVLFLTGNQSRSPVEISLAVLAGGTILVAVITGTMPSSLERFLSSGRAVAIGRRSYGLYLWQYVILEAALGLYPAAFSARHRLLQAAAAGVLVVAVFTVAELSYRYVELPALRQKRRFRDGKAAAGLRTETAPRPSPEGGSAGTR